MKLYSQRHGFRKPMERTFDISIDAYKLLLNCCKKRFDSLAWKYPDKCDYCDKIYSLDKELLDTAIRYEIPDLFRRDGRIAEPLSDMAPPFYEKTDDEYNQYALLDLIEFVAQYCRTYKRGLDDECQHSYLLFYSSNQEFQKYQKEVNDTFEMVGLLYTLNDNRQIERLVLDGPLTKEVEKTVLSIKEDETRKLLREAINNYKSPYPDAHRDATEKIWDAFERLKTYYTSLDKKHSIEKIVSEMSINNPNYKKLFDDEFKALTDIGNQYRIRHHETDKINITDNRYYDYFFNRCLSLIALAVQYLNK